MFECNSVSFSIENYKLLIYTQSDTIKTTIEFKLEKNGQQKLNS